MMGSDDIEVYGRLLAGRLQSCEVFGRLWKRRTMKLHKGCGLSLVQLDDHRMGCFFNSTQAKFVNVLAPAVGTSMQDKDEHGRG